MEDCLTLEEVYLLSDAVYRAEHRRNKFAAALKGISLDEPNDRFEEVEKKAQAALAGQSEEEFVFGMIGIEVDSNEDD